LAVVRLSNVSKRYPGAAALSVDGVTFSVGDGEFMVLLGPSGCGKSTTLRMIAGLESVSSGELSIDGRVVNRVAAMDRDIAMVFQSYALYPHMTVAENLAFGLKRRKVVASQIAERVRAVADSLGLSELLQRKPHALSGGQRQRVALGRALVREPKVFLFDEPLSNLDATLRVSTRNELVRLHQRLGATMIYVTHDQVEAMTMGQRILVMNRGRLAQIGKPLEVYQQPADAFVAHFLGSPPMNLLKARILSRGDCRWAECGSAQLPLDRWSGVDLGGNGLLIGIRPEELCMAKPSPERQDLLRGKVSGVQPLGAETLVMVELDDQAGEVTARLDRHIQPCLDERVALGFTQRALHLFDAETQKSILPITPADSVAAQSSAGA
jgi:multiple sugar transport system ATP-binding protein